MSSRDYSDPAYDAARKAARQRDGGRCVFPGCNVRRGLQAHHVRRWADAPSLRTDPANLVMLCRRHHKEVTGNEDAFAAQLLGAGMGLIVEMVRARYQQDQNNPL